MKKVLFVVDMLKAFLKEGSALYCGEKSRSIIPFVRKKIEEFNSRDEFVFFICDRHKKNDKEFERFPAHSIEGTEEAELVDELKNSAKNCVYIYKRRYSGFYETVLDEHLKAIKPDLVEVVGVCTNICILYTVEELCNRDIKVRVFREGVASFDEDAHNWALKQMKTVLGAEVV
ncbi:MAG: cysteine hydrolase [Planctomycetota bacterium]|nr:cysteine hydrolase [Planctomycetota bacterium]